MLINLLWGLGLDYQRWAQLQTISLRSSYLHRRVGPAITTPPAASRVTLRAQQVLLTPGPLDCNVCNAAGPTRLSL